MNFISNPISINFNFGYLTPSQIYLDISWKKTSAWEIILNFGKGKGKGMVKCLIYLGKLFYHGKSSFYRAKLPC